MYKCKNCEAVFDEDEIAFWREYRGEYGEQSAYEYVSGCPFCNSTEIYECNEDGEIIDG